MSVKLRILNPDVSDLEKTELSVAVSSGTTITVDSVEGLAANDYIIVGDVNTDTAELKKISSISSLTITVDSAIAYSHLAGEVVTKSLYNQIKIYRSTSLTGTYSLLTTVSVDFSNHNGETIYVDGSGTTTNWYKSSYYNSTSTTESTKSDAIRGSGLLAYITLEDFRMRTGIKGSDIGDSELTTYLNRAANKIRDVCYVLRRREKISKTTVDSSERYYFTHLFVADDNLDGVISSDDIEVLERDSEGIVENDITAQVATLNQYDGYFTLNSGYPSDSSYGIFVTYRWTKHPLAEVDDDLKELNLCLAMEWIIKKQMTEAFKRGISGRTLGGLTINRDPTIFKELLNIYKERRKELYGKLKPLRFIKYRGHTGVTQVPERVVQPLKTDSLTAEETLQQKIDRLRRRD